MEVLTGIPDIGCEASTKCLECPLPQCKHDDPAAYQRWRRQRLDAARIATMNRENLTVAEAAERFNITIRTVFRIRARVRAGS